MTFVQPEISSHSLWHLCLYGVGQVRTAWSGGDEMDSLWHSALKELNFRANTSSVSNVISLSSVPAESTLSPDKVNEVLRYFYYFSSEIAGLISLYNLIEVHFSSILRWADRDKYELLATCSMFMRSNRLRQIEFSATRFFFEQLAKILLSTEDPFLFARLANLLFLDGQTVDSRTKEDVFEPTLIKVLNKFQNSMNLISDKEPDEAHSINAFYVFSVSLLGQAIARLPKGSIDKSDIVELKRVADEHFNALPVDEKATQYTFYKLFLMQLNLNDETTLANNFSEISSDYVKSNFYKSPLCYLRSSYLLWEYSQLVQKSSPGSIKVLSDSVIRRLSEISNVSLNCTNKYDNDILCFCYAYVLACFDCNSDLRRHVLRAARSIRHNIKSISYSDLYKLLNCKNVVKSGVAL